MLSIGALGRKEVRAVYDTDKQVEGDMAKPKRGRTMIG